MQFNCLNDADLAFLYRIGMKRTRHLDQPQNVDGGLGMSCVVLNEVYNQIEKDNTPSTLLRMTLTRPV